MKNKRIARWRAVFGGVVAVPLALAACSDENPAPKNAAPQTRQVAETVPAEPFSWKTLDGTPTAVIAHRGASGEFPEHTLAAYERAVDQGADWIEPDLVMTKDGVLVCRHDRYLSTTTDVAARPEFASRNTVKDVDGRARGDWWVEDFTLAEIKTLRAIQPRSDRNPDFNGDFEIPTLAEVIALAKARSTPERPVRLVPETKHPSFFQEQGLDMEGALLSALHSAGWREKTSPVMIQSFEPGILQSLRSKTNVRLVQLVLVENPPRAFILRTEDPKPNLAMDTYAAFVDAVGPQKELVVGPDGEALDFIARAHAAGLVVYPWTFRDDQPARDGASIEAELARIYRLGADGIFTDFPATALRVRKDLDAIAVK